MGYFIMENDFFDAVAKGNFSPAERAVLDCLIRYTKGFSRETCEASARYIAGYCGRSVRGVQQGISRLISRGVIVPTYHPGKPTTWRIRPPEEWPVYEERFGRNSPFRCPEMRTPAEGSCVPDAKGRSYPLRGDVRTRKEKRKQREKLQNESTEALPTPMGRYKNVFLTEEELEAFRSEFQDSGQKIERLSQYLAETGKVYRSHYAVLCRWAREDGEKEQARDKEASRRTYDLAAFDDMDFTKALRQDENLST